MEWVFLLALFFLSLVSAQSNETQNEEGASCKDPACQAYVWGYPLWHAINQRYMYQQSPLYQVNTFTFRVQYLPPPGTVPKLAVCNATLCAGTQSIPLNPSPVNVPYVYFLYGLINWDMGSTLGAVFRFVLPSKTQIRYSSLIFYDQYTSIVHEFNSLNQPTAAPTVFCLTGIPNHPACNAFPPGTIKYVLPRFGTAALRVFTSGTPNPQCGFDGCQYLLGSFQNFAVVIPATNPQNFLTKYNPFMNQDACPYVYGEAPCGSRGNRTAFWEALCAAIVDEPATGAEANYVENNFGNLGIHATHCDTNLAVEKLNRGLTDGYKYVNHYIGNTGVSSGPWVFLPFSGGWNVQDEFSALLRAQSSTRVEYMNSNHATAYWTAWTDSNGDTLSGEHDTTYKIVWRSTDPIVDSARGFWSIHLYDMTYYLYSPPNGTDTNQYAVLGTGIPTTEIHVANTCVGSPCIRSPPSGKFNLWFRAYVYFPNLGPNGGYKFPDIIPCKRNSPCN